MVLLGALLLIGFLTFVFNYLLEKQQNPNKNLPAYGKSGETEVVLMRNRGGHYLAPGQINGQTVDFLLDTGATEISIPLGVSNRLRLKRGAPSYVQTANGTVPVYDTRLDSVSLGNIKMNNLRAHINPHMQGDTVLLGMNFMKHLELLQSGDRLIIRIP